MDISGRVARQIVLFSLLVLIAPMVLFPDRLGLGLAEASLFYAVYELVYYGVVTLLLFRHATAFKLVQVASLCLVYRLVLGALFGFLIAVAYTMSLSVALTLGMSSYLPAILLQIAATPFILKPLATELIPVRKSATKADRRETLPEFATGAAPAPSAGRQGPPALDRAGKRKASTSRPSSSSASPTAATSNARGVTIWFCRTRPERS